MAEENIIRIKLAGKDITLIGTAHISKESALQVERTIAEEKPDSVCVELCQSRFDALSQPQNWQEMDIVKLIKEKKASLLLAQWVVSAYQRRLAQQLGIRPGEEMIRAINQAQALGANIVLADRDIRVTLLRTWRMLSFWGKARLMAELVAAALFNDKISAEDIEKLKKQDVLDMAIASLEKSLPTVKATLIDERDCWLADKIRSAPGNKIVAVIGAGHLAGVAANMEEERDCQPIGLIPPAGIWSKVFAWFIPALIIGFILAGFLSAGSQAGMNMLFWWAIITATAAALGAIIMLSHPATIAAAALAAPFTTLHPFLAAGWVAGITEATMRKPRVKDFLNLRDDIITLRGFFHNKITRILIIVAVVNLTASLGTFAAIPVMMRFF